MSALRKLKPSPQLPEGIVRTADGRLVLSEAEKAFWRAWIKSLNLTAMTVHEPVNCDRTSFDAWNC